MKRIISVLLALSMLFALAACGASREEVKGAVQSEVQSEVQSAEENVQWEIGETSGGEYVNRYMGVGCRLDEEWTFADEPALAELIGLTGEVLGQDYIDQLENVDLFYDMEAEKSDGLENMNCIIQKLEGVSALASLETIISATMEQLPEQFEGTGFEDLSFTQNTVSFAGQERPGIQTYGVISGIPMYQQQVYVKVGSHIAIYTMTTFFEDDTAELLSYFYAVEP